MPVQISVVRGSLWVDSVPGAALISGAMLVS